MKISKYSIGIGDRFGHEAKAQLKAIVEANKKLIHIVPVWNKSFREHSITKTKPCDTRVAADKAVEELNWKDQYFIDADHINMSNVDEFIDHSDFFTIDIAEFIGNKNDEGKLTESLNQNSKLIGKISIPNITKTFKLSKDELELIIKKYLPAIIEAGVIYRHIESKKGKDNFVTEISIDEVLEPQSPIELLIILSLIAHEKIPIQTIAPRFTGRFNKGVDYVGDLSKFEKEFEEDILVIDYAIREFGLPENLKLSVHSGSDKFSIYPIITKIINKHNKGIHIKTAGTTWLEEVIGLAMAEDEALKLAKLFYSEALVRIDELCAPYAQVIDIDIEKLPSINEVEKWSGEKFANTLRHIPDNPDYNPNFRQLIHVGYKIAVEHSEEFNLYLTKYADIIGQQVYENIYDRHLYKLFNKNEQ
ncbi:tagaturonate epimerase family protein [Urechidicola croceus]|uniref:Tagaturonate/fructuronate epimerase n=1 Tax=Urechidicola croceus TaxID=1850246 RepID=A0A1D8P4H4_9FLAO|nr:tagaturonate epimerase family protein [Urechidicola croceus]AOW19482.1 hypothetical protein LPB138_01730 [Urechidicola croceus]